MAAQQQNRMTFGNAPLRVRIKSYKGIKVFRIQIWLLGWSCMWWNKN